MIEFKKIISKNNLKLTIKAGSSACWKGQVVCFFSVSVKMDVNCYLLDTENQINRGYKVEIILCCKIM